MSAAEARLSKAGVHLAILQIAPVNMDAWATWGKLKSLAREAIEDGAEILTWGESLLPGFPGWVNIENPENQQAAWFHHMSQALTLDGPLIADMQAFAREHRVMLIGGIAERDGGSLYSTVVTIGSEGALLGRHRKLEPTKPEQRLWSEGDGSGLRTHETKAGSVGSLIAWENWHPLARGVLQEQEEFVHVGIWPGCDELVGDVTQFIALEARTWSVAASSLLRASDFEALDASPYHFQEDLTASPAVHLNGGSRIIAPDGRTVAGPLIGEEGILVAHLDTESTGAMRQPRGAGASYPETNVIDVRVVDPPTAAKD